MTKKFVQNKLLLIAIMALFIPKDMLSYTSPDRTEELEQMSMEQLIEEAEKFKATFKLEQDLTKRFFKTEQAEKAHAFMCKEGEYEKWQNQMADLIYLLQNDKSDFTLFALGAGEVEYQEKPKFFLDLAQQYPDKRFTIYSIDMGNDPSSPQSRSNISFHRIRTLLPYNEKHELVEMLKTYFECKINAGRIVFIGNYAQIHQLHDACSFANPYLEVKSKTGSKNLVLYNQIGESEWLLFDPDSSQNTVEIHNANIFFDDLNDDSLEPVSFYGSRDWFGRLKSIPFRSFAFAPGMQFDVMEEHDGSFEIVEVSGTYAEPVRVLAMVDYWKKERSFCNRFKRFFSALFSKFCG